MLTAGVTALLAAYLLDTLRAGGRPVLELAETLLLLAFFLVVPAPLAIGMYFTLWHAWRHLGRLLLLPAESASEVTGPLRHKVMHLARDSVPITLAALAILGGLYGWSVGRVRSPEEFTALYLALIAALTLPHALVVALMDVRPRISYLQQKVQQL